MKVTQKTRVELGAMFYANAEDCIGLLGGAMSVRTHQIVRYD